MMSSVILSGLPSGTSVIPTPLFVCHFGLRTATATLFGLYCVIMYGPVDGIGVVDWSLVGVPAGTGAANSVARMLTKSPCGAFSLTVTWPVWSLVVIPLMWPF